MRRRVFSVLATAVVLAALACGEPTPTRPNEQPLAAVTKGPALEAQINGLINALFAPKDQGDMFKAFARIKNQLASGKTADAQASVVAFVQKLLAARQGGLLQDPNGTQPPSIADALRDLVNSVAQFGGLPPPIPPSNPFGGDGAVAVVGPAGGTVVASRGFGGVGFPPGALPADVIVVVSRLPNPVIEGAGPLPTTLTQYPLFYDFSTVPHVAQFAVPVTVGLCRLEVGDPFGPPTQVIADQLQVAHPDPANPTTIEILPVTTAGFVNCNGVTLASARDESEPRSLAARAWDLLKDGGTQVLGLLRPGVAYAIHGGLGGKTTSFSPFAIVLPVTIGPAGGTVTSANGNATLTIPPGALAVATTIGIQALPSFPADPRVTPGTVYDLTPSGLQFAQPATLKIKYTPAVVPGGAFRAQGLRLATVNTAGRWTVDRATQPSVATTDLTASLSHFSTYALLVATDRAAASGEELFSQISCRLNSALDAACWGSNAAGQLGDGTTVQHFTPQAVSGSAGFVQVSAGGRHTCGLALGGAASCWGLDWFGSLGDGVGNQSHSVPGAVVGGHVFVKLAIGYEHSCGITSAGAAYCWGDDQTGELGIGSQGLTNQPNPLAVSGNHVFVDIAAGAWRTCGITDTEDLWCWGNVYGATFALTPALVPGGLKWSAVSIGGGSNNLSTHTCGVSTDGKGYCWGNNFKGELGDPALQTGGQSATPNLVVGGHTFVSIAAGAETSCGIEASGQVFCWGDNSLGTLGDGSAVASRATPGPVSLPGSALSLSGAAAHMCAETVGGQFYCWGDNTRGGLGIGTSAIHFSPSALLGALSFASLSGGAPQCGLVGSQAYCWGINPGNGTDISTTGPVAVSTGAFASVLSDGSTSCWLAVNGALSCWGDNLYGQFGDGSTTASLTPVPAGSGQLFNTVSVGGSSGVSGQTACGVTTQGVALCWGDNSFGQLGDGTGGNSCTGSCNSTTPVAVSGSLNLIQVAVGDGTTCGLTSSNDVYCWGGITTLFPNTPVPVTGGRKFSGVTVGDRYACGIELGTAQAFCWGRRNPVGQQNGLLPTAVSGGLSFVELAAGGQHTCGVTTIGSVYCWGARTDGAIGDGMTTPSFTTQPVQVPGVAATAVRAGFHSTCVLMAGGAVSCWGDDTRGTLGVSSADRFRSVPVLVP